MVKLPNLHGIGGQIAIQFALVAARGFLNKAIEGQTPDSLYSAIVEDKKLLGNIDLVTLESADKLKQNYGFILSKVKNHINTPIILEWLQQDHDDLFSILINTDGGIEWLDRQVNDIKENILYS